MPGVTLNFHYLKGQCADAIALYEKAFGARRTVCVCYADANPHDFPISLSDAQKAYVYHAEMNLYGQRIMLSDDLDGAAAAFWPISVVITFDSLQEVQRAMEVMAEGATIRTPLRTTTYSGGFVSLIDRYGIRWEFMTET